jgi:hypothetical protein
MKEVNPPASSLSRRLGLRLAPRCRPSHPLDVIPVYLLHWFQDLHRSALFPSRKCRPWGITGAALCRRERFSAGFRLICAHEIRTETSEGAGRHRLGLREMGHHDRPAGVVFYRDGGTRALWPLGRAQDQACPDDLAMAFAGSPFSFPVECFRANGDGKHLHHAPAIGIANSRSVSRPRQSTLLVSDNPGRNRRGRLDHRPDPDHERARYHALAVSKQFALRLCDSSPDFSLN